MPRRTQRAARLRPSCELGSSQRGRRLPQARSRSTPAASALLDRAVARLFLSGRGADRARRVAATIAALAGLDRAAEEHMAEALSFRGAAG